MRAGDFIGWKEKDMNLDAALKKKKTEYDEFRPYAGFFFSLFLMKD